LIGRTITFAPLWSSDPTLTVRCDAPIGVLDDHHYYGDLDTSSGVALHFDMIRGSNPATTSAYQNQRGVRRQLSGTPH